MHAPNLIWNPARDVWEMPTIDLFSEHSDVFSETWPVSGSMRSGEASRRPPLVPPTAASESSSSPGRPPQTGVSFATLLDVS